MAWYGNHDVIISGHGQAGTAAQELYRNSKSQLLGWCQVAVKSEQDWATVKGLPKEAHAPEEDRVAARCSNMRKTQVRS